MKKIFMVGISLVLVFAFVGCGGNKNSGKEITISAASSLKEPLQIIADNYQKEAGVKVNINFGSSGTLEKQIDQGAPVDMFISAGKEYMDNLQNKKLIDEASRKDILTNSLVFIVSKNFKKVNSLKEYASTDGKLALGELTTVPAGKYAKETLESLNLWSKFEKRVVYGKDVKGVLTYVESGDVEAGIVYKSDTVGLKNSVVIEEIPNNLHDPIVYPAAVIKESKNKDIAEDFLKYIQNSESKGIFEKYKFVIKE